MFQRLPSPLPSPAWRARESPDRIKQLELVERLDPLEHSLALPRQAALEAFIKSPVPRFLVIRQLVEQKNVVVGAVAGADTPLGVDALTARHGQIVFLPAVVIVAHQLKIIFQRDRRLIVLRDQVGTRLAAPLVEARDDAVAHHEVYAVRCRLHGFADCLKTVGFRHLDAANEVRPHVAFAENVHLIDQASDPTVPTHAPVFPRVNPFKQPLVPHLHVRVMTIHARSPVALHGFFILGIGLQVHEAPPAAPLERRDIFGIKTQLVFAVQRFKIVPPVIRKSIDGVKPTSSVASCSIERATSTMYSTGFTGALNVKSLDSFI